MDTMFINQYGHPLLVRTFSLLQTKGKKRSVKMSLPSVYINSKSVVYCWALTNRNFKLLLSFSKEVIRKQNNCENYGKQGKRNWFSRTSQDKNCSIILETELEKRKTLFQDLQLKFYKKGVYR